jgi:tetratricopeptide (TPR) repeat protein
MTKPPAVSTTGRSAGGRRPLHGSAAAFFRLALAAALAVASARCSRPAGPPPAAPAGGAAQGAPAAPAGSAGSAGSTALPATAAPAASPPVAAELARAARGGRPVLFVGLDGADWRLLDGYMADGTMPNLAGLVRRGVSGVLLTIQPPLSPLVWTTMMTGVSPLAHRVLDFTRFNPESGAREPIGSGERRVPAVWNMASAAGKSVAVFGLWATFPAEPVRGLMVADRFASFTAPDRQPPPGVVFPPSREGLARKALAAAVRETDYAALRRYLPWLDEAEYRRQMAEPEAYAHPVAALQRILAETRAYHGLARAWIERARPDLAIVYFQGTDTIGHLFAPYAPPRQPAVTAVDFARYGGVPRLYFAEVDRLLGDFRDLAASQGAVLFVASDHGFRWREGRPAGLSSAAAATAARWHREEGIYLLWAPDRMAPPSRSRERRPSPAGFAEPAFPARGRGGVAQVCATLLSLLGLPPGDGLAPALDTALLAGGEQSRAAAAAARPVDYRRFFHPAASSAAAATSATAAAADEQLAALRALGYIGAAEPSRRAAGGGSASPPPANSSASPLSTAASDATRTAASFDNEGLLLRQQGQPGPAQAAFEQALARQPGLPSALWNLSDLLFAEAAGAAVAGAAAAHTAPADQAGADVSAASPAAPPAIATPIQPVRPAHTALLDRADDLLLRAVAGDLPGGVDHALERATYYGRAGARGRGLALLDRTLAIRPADPRLWLLRGRYRLEQQRCDAALDDFTRAVALDPGSSLAHASRGLALLCRGDQPAALAAFRRSLALDPNQPEIRRFLAHP